MATKVGVGKSNEKDAFIAGATAAKAALAHTGLKKCDFVFLFATVGYNQEKLLKGVRSVTNDTPLSGCSGAGVITQFGPEGEAMFTLTGTSKGSDVVGVMAFSSDEINFYNCVERDLKENSIKAGEEIGKNIKAMVPGNPLVLLTFPDSYTVNMKNFFSGIDKALGKPLLIAGGLAGHNVSVNPITYQYHNDQVFTDAAPCVLISGNAKIEIGVNHGCTPIGIEKTITKAKANTIYEIENRSAWSFFQEYLGADVKHLNSENAPSISIGEKLPEKMSTDYDKYVIRAPYIQNPDDSIIFATEISEGARVQLVRRDEDKISQGAKDLAERIKSKLGNRKPLAVLHFDCAGRGTLFFGDKVKEKGIDVIQDVFGKDIPWLGFFCYGEIAPIKGINYFHNQTVVLCIIY